MSLLLLYNKYHAAYAGEEKRVETGGDVTFLETLLQAEIPTKIKVYHYDERGDDAGVIQGESLELKNYKYHLTMNEELLMWLAINKPDVIVFWPTGIPNIDPTRILMSVIKRELHIPLILVIGDSVTPWSKSFIDSWLPFVNYVAIEDDIVDEARYDQRYIQFNLSTGTNKKIFYDHGLKKDIDVSFIGNTKVANRMMYLDYLKTSGIDVYVSGGTKKTELSWDEYATLLSRSKITLNFCLNDKYPQIKGRVMEAMACNTMLIEDEGTVTNQLFEEGKDFIMVKSKEDMLEKIQYYLAHDSEREAIAASGHKKQQEFYTAKNIWNYLFKKAKIEFSECTVLNFSHDFFYKMESIWNENRNLLK